MKKAASKFYVFTVEYINYQMEKINADVNGALITLSKSKDVSIETLYNRGEVDTPERIRID